MCRASTRAAKSLTGTDALVPRSRFLLPHRAQCGRLRRFLAEFSISAYQSEDESQLWLEVFSHGVFADQSRRCAILGPSRPMKFTRITTRPDVCTGKPCVRDLRFPVSRLLGLLAAGESRDEILRAYPYLEAADIDEALRYAASLAEDEIIELTG